MKLDDPFPIESFRRNVRDTILSEFGGRCPSIREVLDVPDAAWMSLPGIGPVTLTELRQVLENAPPRTKTRLFEEWTDGELQAERDRLHREVVSIRDSLMTRRHRLMAVTAELRRRGTPVPRAGSRRGGPELGSPAASAPRLQER